MGSFENGGAVQILVDPENQAGQKVVVVEVIVFVGRIQAVGVAVVVAEVQKY